MKIRIRVEGLSSVVFLLILGCSSQPVAKEKLAYSTKRFESVDKAGKILDIGRFDQGGKLLIIPFKPGEGVESNEDLDKFSLSAIRGIMDVLNEKGANFEVLSTDNAGDAELVMKGYVTSLETPSKMKTWLPGKETVSLSIEGRIIERQTEETIFIFSDTIEMTTEKDIFRKLGERVGRDIGQFMVQGASAQVEDRGKM